MPLSISNLTYRVNGKPLINNLDWDLADGSMASLRGPTGAGKTTTGLLATKLLPARFHEKDLPRGLTRQWAYLLGTITGDLRSSSPALYMPSNPLETLIFPSVSDELESITVDRSAIASALEKVNLDESRVGYNILGRELHQLSGGMLQRLALARVYLQRANLRLVVADEAYEWLDPEGQAVFQEVLQEISVRGGISLALQSTSAPKLSKFDEFSLNGGIKSGSTARLASTWRAARQHHSQGEAILEVSSLSKAYVLPGAKNEKKVSIVSDASLSGHEGEWVGIHGPNGIGKSVLCRLIAGLEKEDTGHVSINGRACKPDERRQAVGYIFQFPNLQLPLPSLKNMLDQTLPKRLHQAVYQKLEPELDVKKHVLLMTPCDQRLVLLSILLARKVRVLIVDEPTWGSDIKEIERIIKFLSDEEDGKRLTIIVSHNEDLLAEVSDKRYEMRDGFLRSMNSGRN
jgi:ABC-type multidrug transport system ATPase subunit